MFEQASTTSSGSKGARVGGRGHISATLCCLAFIQREMVADAAQLTIPRRPGPRWF